MRTRTKAGMLAALAIMLGVITMLAPAADAQPTVQGIADSGPRTFKSPLWHGLNVRHVRAIVPYNVALLPERNNRRHDFEEWLFRAKAAGASVNVGLGRIKQGPGRGHAPDERTYRRAFRAFVSRYGRIVDTIGPWNEPNFRPNREQRLLLPDRRHFLDDPNAGCARPTVNNCGPRLAAYYYRWAAHDCRRCTLAAGEFAGTQSSNYVQKYKLHLGPRHPAVWSVHNYADVIRFQVRNNHQAAELRMFVRELYCLRGNHCIRGKTTWTSGQLWIGAVGAYYQLDCHAHRVSCTPGRRVHVFGPISQCRAAAFINRLPGISSKITRIYYYTFSDRRTGDNTGLVAAGSGRPAYAVIRDRAKTCRA